MVTIEYRGLRRILTAALFAGFCVGCGLDKATQEPEADRGGLVWLDDFDSEEVQEPEVEPDEWLLIWQDEFDGPEVDLTRWEHEVGGHGWGNNELQYYTARPENSFILDGALVIQALEEDYGGRRYTSARMRTLDDWLYGRFVVCARLPRGQGLWPAIWMLPSESVYGEWAASGEIDVMEMVGFAPNSVHGTLHYGGSHPNTVNSGGTYTLSEGDFSEAFHIFALEWEPHEMRWYVDGSLYQTQEEWFSENGEYPAPFDQRFHFILNVAVGGDWPGPPDETTVFPQAMMVDYVRVYQRVAP